MFMVTVSDITDDMSCHSGPHRWVGRYRKLLGLAIRAALRLICFAPKITPICFRRAETRARAAGSPCRENLE